MEKSYSNANEFFSLHTLGIEL